MSPLTCCVCGDGAGRFQQHWNRDTEYGVCVTCVGELFANGMSAAEIESNYGKAGVNFGHRYRLGARTYNLKVVFRSDKSDAANAWMAAHPDDALLGEVSGFLLIASRHDHGSLPEEEDA